MYASPNLVQDPAFLEYFETTPFLQNICLVDVMFGTGYSRWNSNGKIADCPAPSA